MVKKKSVKKAQKKNVKKSQKKKASEKVDSSNTIYLLTHLLGLITGFFGPLILLVVSDDENVKKHARKALNWQLSFLIYILISFFTIFLIIGIILFPVLIILNIVFSIMAMVKANKGELWEYPLAIPFFKD